MNLSYAIAEGYVTKEPVRGTEHSAGLDVFVPELNAAFWKDFEKMNSKWAPFVDHEHIYVQPSDRILVPTGLRFNLQEGTYLEVANRSSMASKYGLIYGAHIIDEDYTGIVFINLINTSHDTFVFEPGIKFAQLIHKEYIKSIPTRIDESEIRETARGAGALGHTGK